MANPQLENGYTKISNEILEALPGFKFTGGQFSILLIVLRYTYGFNRKYHSFALSFLESATGLKKRSIQKDLDVLFESSVLFEFKSASFSKAREFGINKNYEEWKIESRIPQMNPSYTGELQDTSTGELQDTSTGELQDTSTGELQDTQEIKIKEIYKDNIKEIVVVDPITNYIPDNVIEIQKNNNDNFITPEKFYQDNIGLINPLIAQSINHWINDGVEESLIVEYMKQAVANNVLKWNYIDTCIRNGFQNDIKTLEKHLSYEKDRRRKSLNQFNSKSKQTPQYANFEQREYSEEYYEKFYANLQEDG